MKASTKIIFHSVLLLLLIANGEREEDVFIVIRNVLGEEFYSKLFTFTGSVPKRWLV